ncbi:MAG: ATP-binding protein [Bacteroidota bacterium]
MIVLLFITTPIIAQHEQLNDLSIKKNQLHSALQNALQNYNNTEALEIADRIIAYSKKAGDSLFWAYALNAKATLYMYIKDYKSAKQYAYKNMKLNELLGKHNRLIDAYCLLSDISLLKGQPDSSSTYLNRVQGLINDSTGTIYKSIYYNQKTSLYAFTGRIDSSLHYTFKRIALIKNGEHYELGNGYLELSNTLFKVNDYEKSLDYINKGLDAFNKNAEKLPLTIAKTLVFKGKILYAMDKFKTIESVLQSALDLIKNKDKADLTAQIYILKAQTLAKLGENKKAKNYINNAIFQQGKLSPKTLFDYYLTSITLNSKTYDETIEPYILKLEELEKTLNNPSKEIQFHQLSADYWSHRGYFEKAYESQKLYQEAKEKINNQQQTYAVYDLENKYQLSIKDKEIANQKLILNEKEKDFQLAILGSSLLLITSLGIWLFYRQKQKLKNKEIETLVAQKELSKLEALIAGEENERKRIAQDLHDGINGDLSVIKYKMTSIDQNRFKPKEEEAFSMAIDMLDNAIDQVRHISHNLVPPSLQNFNLIEALQQFSSKISSTNTIKINFQQYGEYLKLNKDAETAIYRIIQELITNSVKHSKATKALVQINSHDENLHITVEDNGIGFDTTKTYKGIGFKNIESRVALLNADFSVDSNSKGSTFTVDINTSELRDD